MTGREIIETVEFGGGPASSGYVKTDGGQLVTPEFLAFIQQALHGRLTESAETAALAPEVKALAEELSVVHLPAWRSPSSPRTAEPTVTGLKQATRVAEYLVQRGVRLHPELEEIRWMPTPGGPPGAFDTGIHITRDEHGLWPEPDPEQFYNLDDIEVAQGDDGLWHATHPRGLSCAGPSRTDAYATLVDQLRLRIEQARNSSS